MKLKLAQRLAFGYYRTKFRALSIFSSRKAAEAVFKLFCTPYSGKPKRKTPPVFQQAGQITFDLAGTKVRGWRWMPETPSGKKILIVHGFDSCSYRFDGYIVPLTGSGFEVVAFDAPGHGLSDGQTLNALVYSQAVLKAEALYGSFYGIVAHSLGGLAAALAFEQLPRQEDRKLVLVSPTTQTTTAIENFFRVIPVTPRIRGAFMKLIEEVGQKPVAHYSVKRAITRIKAPVLWIHDADDNICPYGDAKEVQELQLPGVEFFITKGLGHSGIYRQSIVFQKIMEFFGESSMVKAENA